MIDRLAFKLQTFCVQRAATLRAGGVGAAVGRAMIAASLLIGGPVLIAPQGPAQAQGNDNDSTPLNSRIRRSRPFPTEPRSFWQPGQLNEARRERSRTMVDQLARCLWNRSNEDGLDLLARTDFGFQYFEQIGIPTGEVTEHYAIGTCMDRVARNANSSIMLRFTGPSMRQWYIQAAYFDRNEDGPEWIKPGLAIDERTYPLSANNPAVHASMDFADCVVAQDPHSADYFYRTAPQSDAEMEAIQALVPALGSCLPQGQEMEIDPTALRLWIGEGLWHASNNLVPISSDNPEDEQ